jgi:hypothetical protein
MRRLALIPLLLLLAGCPGVRHAIVRPDKNPPQLRTRPNFTGVHYEIQTACVKKVEWFEGWCEDGDKPNQRICHDVIIEAPPSCVTVNAGGKK